MWEKALELASRITHPYTVAAFVAVIAAAVFVRALKTRKKRGSGVLWALGVGILLLGLAPTIASAVLQHQGVYHIRITVLDPDKQPNRDAEVSSSVGGELKRASLNWEFDIAPQARPSDGRTTFFATERDRYLAGSASLQLDSDYFPEVTILLQPLPSAVVRGVVVVRTGRSVEGARVSILGYPEIVTTDAMGNFVLSAHAADGQMVSVRAEKGALVAEQLLPAGKTGTLVMRRR